MYEEKWYVEDNKVKCIIRQEIFPAVNTYSQPADRRGKLTLGLIKVWSTDQSRWKISDNPPFKQITVFGDKRPGIDLPLKQQKTNNEVLSQDWNRLIVGKLSPYLEIDCQVEHVRKQSEAVFLQELEFASHLSLPAILLPLRSKNIRHNIKTPISLNLD
ncbi:hypothetical protein CBL_00330 [Carabus blaptoides fortunei]